MDYLSTLNFPSLVSTTNFGVGSVSVLQTILLESLIWTQSISLGYVHDLTTFSAPLWNCTQDPVNYPCYISLTNLEQLGYFNVRSVPSLNGGGKF
jgi:hypothetical protein